MNRHSFPLVQKPLTKYPSTWGSHPKKKAIKWEKQIHKYFTKHLPLFNKYPSTWRTHTRDTFHLSYCSVFSFLIQALISL
ncbi:hypothetical protein VIGAN_04229600 [Vigna angularis var. angularis]|uniref:Uncharacterized protein n=1 Tax=Vigna angularis var. angularis TaxID=157739 RepID=A0A0S3RW66_PHAAN|nr:hypothetical protein VIGAN_04229600 [Vigna angularis var. angularis]